MFIDIICGARPNFIKISPIVRELQILGKRAKNNIVFRIVHTGQHYDRLMSKSFFNELGIPKPHINLNAKSGSHAQQTSEIMIRYEKLLSGNKPSLCLVVGDVNSTLACSVVAKKNGVKIAHVEAGLRSGDMSMPEEINRIVTDSISDIFFTTSLNANKNLLSEGKKSNQIYFVGNTMIDTLIYFRDKLIKPKIFDKEDLKRKKYFVLTLHRPINVDNKSNYEKILKKISFHCDGRKIIYPAHPRTANNIKNIKLPKNMIVTKPMSYLEFLFLIKNSSAVITDSGGITEETTYLKIPCLTIRESTERPETILIGSNILIGNNDNSLKKYLSKIITKKWKKSKVPHKWDGKTSKRIVKVIYRLLNNNV
tara:strand:+ start:3440 stop:4540 length:1101 start_codon:yes stop_codon:yes gene_type:complete